MKTDAPSATLNDITTERLNFFFRLITSAIASDGIGAARRNYALEERFMEQQYSCLRDVSSRDYNDRVKKRQLLANDSGDTSAILELALR